MTDRADLPPELEELHQRLSNVRFERRASLGPELVGRLRRGERSTAAAPSRRLRPTLLLGAVAAAVAALVLAPAPRVNVDRCCYDLDGGGAADDGVTLVAERDARVHRLRVYEDRDGSKAFSPGDVVRLDRGSEPSMQGAGIASLVTIDRCCLDFDGGGPADDGLLVIGVPPDRVMMAAIYERTGGAPSPSAPPSYLLR